MLKRFVVSGVLGSLLITGIHAGEFADAQAKVKAKYPAEFAEVQKLAATDISAAQKKLAELARKGNIKLPRERNTADRRSRSGRNGRFEGRTGRFGGRSGMDGRGGRGGRGGMGMRMGQFNPLRRFTAESLIKSKFAAEYAAADRKLLEAVAEIEALASKAKITLPLSSEMQIRKLRAKAPEEFAKLEELAESDPRRVFSELNALAEKHKIELRERREGGQRSRRASAPEAPTRENPQQIIRRLQKKYPEEMRRIMALRKEDQSAFVRELRELNRRDREKK